MADTAPKADKAPEPEKAPESPVAEVVEEVQHEFEVVRDFTARVKTQLLRFFAGDLVAHHVGADLYKQGAPVRPVS